jgi:transcriptional regulator NrdR family protein
METVKADLSIRVSKNTGLEPFAYEKLFLDVYDSISHRKTAQMDAKQLSATIISKLIPCRTGVLKSSEIKATALEVLKRFDKAGATHYKAHHLQ